MTTTSWRSLLTDALTDQGETWEDVVESTLTDEALERRFDDGYGGSEGCAFTLWTFNRVYFPVVYDGAEWVSSVPRNPCDEATSHVGGQ